MWCATPSDNGFCDTIIDVLLSQTRVFVMQSLQSIDTFIINNKSNKISSSLLRETLRADYGFSSTQRKDHREILKQAWTCFGSAVLPLLLCGLRHKVNIFGRRTSGPSVGSKEGLQGRNGTLGTPLCCVDVEHKTVLFVIVIEVFTKCLNGVKIHSYEIDGCDWPDLGPVGCNGAFRSLGLFFRIVGKFAWTTPHDLTVYAHDAPMIILPFGNWARFW